VSRKHARSVNVRRSSNRSRLPPAGSTTRKDPWQRKKQRR
jgi:hypothetical protein